MRGKAESPERRWNRVCLNESSGRPGVLRCTDKLPEDLSPVVQCLAQRALGSHSSAGCQNKAVCLTWQSDHCEECSQSTMAAFCSLHTHSNTPSRDKTVTHCTTLQWQMYKHHGFQMQNPRNYHIQVGMKMPFHSGLLRSQLLIKTFLEDNVTIHQDLMWHPTNTVIQFITQLRL